MSLHDSQIYSTRVVEVLKETRIRNGLSQNKLAEMTGLSRAAIQHIEKGIRNPTLIVVHALSKALNLSVSEVARTAEVEEK